MNPTTHYGLQGTIKVSIVEKGKVVRTYKPQRNLILNRGLDDIASNTIGECFRYCAAGTGSTATELLSGSETATLSTGTVTISQTGFLAGDSSDVGRTIKLTSGGTYLVIAAISATQCTVTPADTTSPDNFTIYNTNQTGLTSESTLPGPSSKRTQTYLTGAPDCQTVTTGATTLMTRTFDFAAETGSITYNEVGFSATQNLGNNLFSRIKLPSGVPLTIGQQLRVQYSLSVTVSPITPLTFSSSPIIGWPSATGTLQHHSIPMLYVSTTGQTSQGTNSVDGFFYANSGEPSQNLSNLIIISTNSNPHGTYGFRWLDGSITNVAVGLSSYVAGTYTRDKSGTFPVGSANATNWRAYISIVNIGDGNFSGGARYLMDVAQTKASTFTLTLGFRTTWGRILT